MARSLARAVCWRRVHSKDDRNVADVHEPYRIPAADSNTAVAEGGYLDAHALQIDDHEEDHYRSNQLYDVWKGSTTVYCAAYVPLRMC